MILSIIIPVFNEEKTIKEVLKKVVDSNTLFFQKEIIVVNDGSKDRSKEMIKEFQKENRSIAFKIFNLESNLGKGAAVRKGFSLASGDMILIQDADLEYNPDDYPVLLKGDIDVVFGKRDNRIYPERGLHYLIGSNLLTFFFNLLFFSNLSDICTGYKLFKADYLKKFNLNSSGFEIESELTAKLIKAGAVIKEVKINYKPRSKKQGKKIKPRDAVIGLLAILRYRFFN